MVAADGGLEYSLDDSESPIAIVVIAPGHFQSLVYAVFIGGVIGCVEKQRRDSLSLVAVAESKKTLPAKSHFVVGCLGAIDTFDNGRDWLGRLY